MSPRQAKVLAPRRPRAAAGAATSLTDSSTGCFALFAVFATVLTLLSRCHARVIASHVRRFRPYCSLLGDIISAYSCDASGRCVRSATFSKMRDRGNFSGWEARYTIHDPGCRIEGCTEPIRVVLFRDSWQNLP